MFTFFDMLTRLAMVVSESSFGAYAVFRGLRGSSGMSALVIPQAMFQVIKELCIQVTDPSALVMGSAGQTKMKVTTT